MFDPSLPASLQEIKSDSSHFLAGAGEQARVRGLSTAHISAQRLNTPPKQPEYQSPGVKSWSEGALFKVHLGGWKIPQVGGGERGVVGEFNRASRLRALRMLAKTDRQAQSFFYTLTYSDAFAEQVCLSYAGASGTGRKVKRDLDTWRRRLNRDYPGVGVFWRVETIDRKSGEFVGEIFPHLHGFLWGVENLQEVRTWLSHTWAEVAAAGAAVDLKHVQAGTQVQAPSDWGAVMAYASKMVYATKAGDSQLSGLGRWWGAFNREAIPWSSVAQSQISEQAALKVSRTVRKYLTRKTGLDGHRLAAAKSLTIFTDNPGQWARLADFYADGDMGTGV